MPGQKFGKRLKELREQSGLSRQEVAEKVGIDPAYLEKLEDGSKVAIPPSGKVIQRLANLLGGDEGELTALAAKLSSSSIIKSRAGKTLAIVTGGVGILLSTCLIVLGLLTFLKPVPTEYEGFYSFYSIWSLHTGGNFSAILVKSADTEINSGPTGSLDTLKVKVSAKNTSDIVFIGTANQTDIGSYLEGVAYQQVTGLRIFPFFQVNTDYHNLGKDKNLVDPASESFWVRSASGTGTQELVWQLEPSQDSLLIVDTNGLQDAEVVFASRSPLTKVSGFGYLLAALILMPLSIILAGLGIKARSFGPFPQ